MTNPPSYLINSSASPTKNLKDNLGRLARPTKISDRERADVRKAIEEAETFFEKLNNPAALKELHLLETQFNNLPSTQTLDTSK